MITLVSPIAKTKSDSAAACTREEESISQTTKTKRRRHHKVRTGCGTCKIRKVRCDEAKPSCTRCVSSGRKCDGYVTSLSQPLPRAPRGAVTAMVSVMPLPQRRKGSAESRSFMYFIEVTAPSLAGAMDVSFWTREIPMICQHDEAIWHAVVCLSAAYESYVSGCAPKPHADEFRLNQFSSAVRLLLKSYSVNAWWRALVISTIFTCVSILEDNYEQALMHFRSGYNLLQDFDTTADFAVQPRDEERRRGLPAPVSLRSIRTILIGFEMRSNRSHLKTLARSPSLLSQESNLSRWESYALPRCPPAFGRYLTADHLSEAISAAETLFYELAITSQVYTRSLRSLYQAEKGGRLRVSGQTLSDPKQASHQRAILEIQQAIVLFTGDFESRSWPRSRTDERVQLHRSLLSLRTMHLTNRFVIRSDPVEPDASRRAQGLPQLCATIVDLAEEIMSLEKSHGCLRSGASMATVMNPLYYVVKSGFGSHTRRRALNLLRRPRTEGLWDTLQSAGLAKACMDREERAVEEYRYRHDLPDVAIDDYTSRGWEAEEAGGEGVHPLARICNITMTLGTGRQTTVGLRTWLEWLEDLPGHDVLVEW